MEDQSEISHTWVIFISGLAHTYIYVCIGWSDLEWRTHRPNVLLGLPVNGPVSRDQGGEGSMRTLYKTRVFLFFFSKATVKYVYDVYLYKEYLLIEQRKMVWLCRVFNAAFVSIYLVSLTAVSIYVFRMIVKGTRFESKIRSEKAI